MTIFDFDTLMTNATHNGYQPLVFDDNNDIALCLLADGKTAVVLCRNRGEIGRFERETYFTGGHWSDLDIGYALDYI